ncbi:general stress protein [Methylibium sp.]|uniref:general stress protein n=1 Tax=Methylibium sp. TaxID=2067992 RepID=UPI003BAC4CF5
MEHTAAHQNAVVAVFTRHQDAEEAVRKLASGGFDMTHYSIVGQGFHSEEKVVGFYNMGDRIKFWGKNGAFWGGLWSLFFGGIFLTIPMVGPVMVLGHLAAMVVAAVEGAILFGGLSALGAALFSIGIPKDSVIEYEQAVKTDGFLVVGHGSADEMARSKAILQASNPTRVDVHENVKAQVSDAGAAAQKADQVMPAL